MSIKKMMGVAIAAIAAGLALATVPANAQYTTLAQNGAITTVITPGYSVSGTYIATTPVYAVNPLGVVDPTGAQGLFQTAVLDYNNAGDLAFVYSFNNSKNDTLNGYGFTELTQLTGFTDPTVQVEELVTNNTGQQTFLATDSGSGTISFVNGSNKTLNDSISFVVYTSETHYGIANASLSDGGNYGPFAVYVPTLNTFNSPIAPEPASFAAFGVTGLLVLLLAVRSRVRKPMVTNACA